MAQRFDRGVLRAPQKLANGYLRTEAWVTRVGVFRYLNTDGTMRRELRHPDEVFRAQSLATINLLPVTLEHPKEMLDSDNTTRASVGTTGESAEAEGIYVRSNLQVHDAVAIDKVERGEARELSMGYYCTKDATPGITEGIPGIPDGLAYDVVQRNITYNHVAITSSGRAGPEVAIPRFDSADGDVAVMVCDSSEQDPTTHTSEYSMETIVIDGIEFKVEAPVAQAYRKQRATQQAETDSAAKAQAEAKTAAETAEARADAAEAKVKDLEGKLTEATDPTAIRKAAEARARLVTDATAVFAGTPEAELPKFAELTDSEVRKAIIGKLSPELELAERSDHYLEVSCDSCLSMWRRSSTSQTDANADGAGRNSIDAVRRGASTPAEVTDSKAKRAEMIKAQEQAWRQPIKHGTTKVAAQQ